MSLGVRVRMQCGAGDGDAALAGAIVELLDREHAATVCVVPALMGFGVGRPPAGTTWSAGGSGPLIIEWVDDPDHVTHVWPRLAGLLRACTVTREEVELLTPIPLELLRRRLDVAVADAMRPDPLHVDAALPATEAVRALALLGLAFMPVVDDAGRLVGVLRAGDPALEAAAAAGLPAAGAMDTVPVTATLDARLRDVVTVMLERHLAELPVVHDRVPVGVLSLEDALRVASGEHAPAGIDDPGRALRALVPGV